MAQACAAGCHVVIFPEAHLSGYADPLRFPGAARSCEAPEVAAFVALTGRHGIAAAGGFLETNPGGLPFLTQVLAQDGALIGVYRKNHIPAEERHLFTPATGAPVFTLRAPAGPLRCALAVCADSDLPELYMAYAQRGAQVVFHASAPGLNDRCTDAAAWQAGYDWYRGYLAERLPGYARAHRLPIAVATQTGATVDEDFPGGSVVFGPDGTCQAATSDWHEALLVHTLNVEC